MTIDQFVENLKVGHHRTTCPSCSPHRKRMHQKEQCLSVDVSYDKVLWNCHHCGETGVSKLTDTVFSSGTKADPNEATAYFKQRGISQLTIDECGVSAVNKYINVAGKEVMCVAFPYYDQEGKHTATKFRSVNGKGFSCEGSPKGLWGIEKYVEGDVWITEGEIDAMSLVQAGIENAFSIPNGVPGKPSKGYSEDAFAWLWSASEAIKSAQRVIICGDNDEPGRACSEEIARRIGRDKCWRVVLPEGMKDVNEALIKLGNANFRKLLDTVEPWPVSGLYDASHFYEDLKKIRKEGLDKGVSTGYSGVDKIYRIGSGMLSVVTGNPSAGKSEFVDQIMCNIAEREDWKFALCSFENDPRFHITKLISKRLRSSFWENPPTDDDFNTAFEWVKQHFSFLYHSDGSLSDLKSILERLRVAVLRYGIRGAVIDPYNYIMKEKGLSETEWISQMLTEIKTFCMAHDVHVWFVAHPTKPASRGQDGKPPMPKGYDISGSAAWWAKADQGITVHRDSEQPNLTMINIWKMRFAWLGGEGSTVLEYHPKQSIFTEGESLDFDPTIITGTERDADKSDFAATLTSLQLDMVNAA